ncbi:MAG: hypothetical protein HY785_06370 [Oscillatoriophycideae cyanobacterium NC_groundwater_1537_Pr4_S-0.65um_50_18]|nr:hypothetical protein [Oscillatoriophycideae cyanobacterium NC_groundwater_1537_Pr4_S-0.65um_50_18]
MKLIQITRDELIVHFYPWFKWLMWGSLTGIGLFAFVLGSEWGTLDCNRNLLSSLPGQCTLVSRTWFTSSQHHWQLKQLADAFWVGEAIRNNGQPLYYQLYLNTSQGVVKLPIRRSEPEEAKATLRQIQEFVADPQRSQFRAQQDTRGESLPAFIAGGCFGLLSQMVTLRLNKRTGKLTVKRYSVLGVHRFEYPLRQVKDASIQVQRRGSHLMGRVVIVGTVGKPIVVHPYDLFVTPSNSSVSMWQIQNFLQLDELEVDSAPNSD